MSRLIRVRVGKLPGVASPTATTMLSSIANDVEGIGWTFDGDYECGQYCNGDWFVVGPVTINDIAPGSFDVGGVIRSGSMVNPNQSDRNGFDNTTSGTEGSYLAELNVGFEVTSSNPLTLQAGSSLITTVTTDAYNDRPFVEAARVLTVVDAVPPEGSFRPPYSAGVSKAHSWQESDIDYTKLPRVTPPDDPNVWVPSEHAHRFARVWLDAPGDPTIGRGWHPRTSMPHYGRELCGRTNDGALALCLDYSDADKRDLLIGYVQVGIDSYGVTFGGGSFWSVPGWYHNGGHGHGRKLPMLVAGLVLGDQAITDRAANSDVWFQEDDQTFIVTQEDVDRTQEGSFIDQGNDNVDQITQAMLGMPEWGIRHRGTPTRDNASPTARYRTNENSPLYAGMTMAALLLALKAVWNNPSLFDYCDRFYGLVNDPDWPDLDGVTREDKTDSRVHQSMFGKAMWDTYRGDYP